MCTRPLGRVGSDGRREQLGFKQCRLEQLGFKQRQLEQLGFKQRLLKQRRGPHSVGRAQCGRARCAPGRCAAYGVRRMACGAWWRRVHSRLSSRLMKWLTGARHPTSEYGRGTCGPAPLGRSDPTLGGRLTGSMWADASAWGIFGGYCLTLEDAGRRWKTLADARRRWKTLEDAVREHKTAYDLPR